MKKNKLQEKGQALVIIALAALVLFGFAALAIDGSRVFSDRRNAQNAADTAAMAAALAKIRTGQGQPGPNYITAALNRASSNNYTNGVNGATVTVNLCSDAGVTCIGLPTGAIPSEYIKVKITSIVPMTFAKVIGKKEIPNAVEAIARANSTPPPTNGAGLVAVRNDNSDKCFQVNGNANLTIHGSGISTNCTGSSALFLNGSAAIGMDANAQVAGCTNNPGFPIAGDGEIACSTPQPVMNAATFASYPTTLPTPSCTSAGSQSGGNMTPGNFNAQVTISQPTTLAPGTYCLNAGLKFTGGGSISGTGTVQLVMGAGQGITIKSNGAFDGLEIYVNNADFTLNGATLTANRLRFFGLGTGGFGVQGGTLTSGNAYIYSAGGLIDIQAQATVNLVAPPSGDTFAGMLIYMPWSNTNPFDLNGGTDDRLTGLILVPHSDVTYNGGSGFELHGQVIGYTFKINGSGHSDIFYDGTGVAQDPTIEFTR